MTPSYPGGDPGSHEPDYFLLAGWVLVAILFLAALAIAHLS